MRKLRMPARTPSLTDERSISTEHRVAGLLGPRSTSFTLAWLARHRGRLHSLLLGGRRLTLLVIYDHGGAEPAPRPSELEVACLRVVINGVPDPDPEPEPSQESRGSVAHASRWRANGLGT